MNRSAAALVLAASLILPACMLGVAGGRPPRRPEPLTRNEAVSLGQSWCRQRAYDCRLVGANLVKGHDLWKVKFHASDDPRGRRHEDDQGRRHKEGKKRNVHLEFDSWTGELLSVKG
ncbi:hypothetical protein [Vulgatibacter incomptus]|uniref:Putative lipoprotein n=1 Tax=Vulgatibacter incomptus TaxID=1391653 RepID=A0A0K1P951_9BACT|nr:hypothetical protein [Vulgatibacter incomptus]AKU89946.1 putative lipoprotein [Vulgatibacter incomptus]